MQVENEFLDENIVRSSSSALELRESAMYYGGVPPNFTMERFVLFKNYSLFLNICMLFL